MNQAYIRKVWSRYFGIIFLMFIMVYIFPNLGKTMPIMLGAFTSKYFYTAIPSMRPTFRQNCCSFVGFLFLIIGGYLLIEYSPYYLPWMKDTKIESTIDFLILMSVMLVSIMTLFLSGYIIALCLSVLLFGRGEIANMTIKEYMLKDLPKRRVYYKY